MILNAEIAGIAEGDEWHARRADGLSGPGIVSHTKKAAAYVPDPLSPSAGPEGRRHSSPLLGLYSGLCDLSDPCV